MLKRVEIYKHYRIPLQLGNLCLNLLGLLLCCGSLRVTLTMGLGKLLLPHMVSHLQVRHQGIGFAYLREEASIILLEPIHPGELMGQLVAFIAQHLLQQLQSGKHEQKTTKMQLKMSKSCDSNLHR